MLHRLVALLILTAALVLIFFKVENSWIAVSAMGLLLVVLFVYRIALTRVRKRKREKILETGKYTATEIMESKILKEYLILQLRIPEQEQSYYTSHIIKRPNDTQVYKYIKGAQLDVCVHPDDKYTVFIEDEIGIPKSWSISNLGETVLVVFLISLFIVPFFFENSKDENTYHQTSKIIALENQTYRLWQVYIKNFTDIIIRVYDPATNEKIASIDTIMEDSIASNGHLSICQQNEKVFIYGNWYAPIIAVYDARLFKKIMDKRAFEQSFPFLEKGIASMNTYQQHRSKFNKEDILEFDTRDNKKYFYIIKQNRFLHSEEEVEKYVFTTDSAFISEHGFCFALLKDSNSIDKYRVCILETEKEKDISTLVYYAGHQIILKDFMWDTRAYEDKTKPVPKPITGPLDNARVAWFDFETVVVEQHIKTSSGYAYSMTGFNKTGQILFTLKQSDFPNYEQMKEEEFLVPEHFHYDIIRDRDFLILTFSDFGAVCVNLQTGLPLWKIEP
jgi:membrane protein YdbS with pleckstrin-like domain